MEKKKGFKFNKTNLILYIFKKINIFFLIK